VTHSRPSQSDGLASVSEEIALEPAIAPEPPSTDPPIQSFVGEVAPENQPDLLPSEHEFSAAIAPEISSSAPPIQSVAKQHPPTDLQPSKTLDQPPEVTHSDAELTDDPAPEWLPTVAPIQSFAEGISPTDIQPSDTPAVSTETPFAEAEFSTAIAPDLRSELPPSQPLAAATIPTVQSAEAPKERVFPQPPDQTSKTVEARIPPVGTDRSITSETANSSLVNEITPASPTPALIADDQGSSLENLATLESAVESAIQTSLTDQTGADSEESPLENIFLASTNAIASSEIPSSATSPVQTFRQDPVSTSTEPATDIPDPLALFADEPANLSFPNTNTIEFIAAPFPMQASSAHLDVAESLTEPVQPFRKVSVPSDLPSAQTTDPSDELTATDVSQLSPAASSKSSDIAAIQPSKEPAPSLWSRFKQLLGMEPSQPALPEGGEMPDPQAEVIPTNASAQMVEPDESRDSQGEAEMAASVPGQTINIVTQPKADQILGDRSISPSDNPSEVIVSELESTHLEAGTGIESGDTTTAIAASAPVQTFADESTSPNPELNSDLLSESKSAIFSPRNSANSEPLIQVSTTNEIIHAGEVNRPISSVSSLTDSLIHRDRPDAQTEITPVSDPAIASETILEKAIAPATTDISAIPSTSNKPVELQPAIPVETTDVSESTDTLNAAMAVQTAMPLETAGISEHTSVSSEVSAAETTIPSTFTTPDTPGIVDAILPAQRRTDPALAAISDREISPNVDPSIPGTVPIDIGTSDSSVDQPLAMAETGFPQASDPAIAPSIASEITSEITPIQNWMGESIQTDIEPLEMVESAETPVKQKFLQSEPGLIQTIEGAIAPGETAPSPSEVSPLQTFADTTVTPEVAPLLDQPSTALEPGLIQTIEGAIAPRETAPSPSEVSPLQTFADTTVTPEIEAIDENFSLNFDAEIDTVTTEISSHRSTTIPTESIRPTESSSSLINLADAIASQTTSATPSIQTFTDRSSGVSGVHPIQRFSSEAISTDSQSLIDPALPVSEPEVPGNSAAAIAPAMMSETTAGITPIQPFSSEVISTNAAFSEASVDPALPESEPDLTEASVTVSPIATEIISDVPSIQTFAETAISTNPPFSPERVDQQISASETETDLEPSVAQLDASSPHAVPTQKTATEPEQSVVQRSIHAGISPAESVIYSQSISTEPTVTQLLSDGTLPNLLAGKMALGHPQPLGNFASLLPQEPELSKQSESRANHAEITDSWSQTSLVNPAIPVQQRSDSLEQNGIADTRSALVDETGDDLPESWSSIEELLGYGDEDSLDDSGVVGDRNDDWDGLVDPGIENQSPTISQPTLSTLFPSNSLTSNVGLSNVVQQAIAPPISGTMTDHSGIGNEPVPVQFSFRAPEVQPVQFSLDYGDSSGTDAPIQAQSVAGGSSSKYQGNIPGMANFTENLMTQTVQDTFGDVKDLLDDRIAREEKMPEELNLEILAREIYHLIRQRFAIERERQNALPYSGRLPW